MDKKKIVGILFITVLIVIFIFNQEKLYELNLGEDLGFRVIAAILIIITIVGVYNKYEDMKDNKSPYIFGGMRGTTRSGRRGKDKTIYRTSGKKNKDGFLGWKKVGRRLGLITTGSRMVVARSIGEISRAQRKLRDKVLSKQRKDAVKQKTERKSHAGKRKKNTEKIAKGKHKQTKKDQRDHKKGVARRRKQREKESKQRVKGNKDKARRRGKN